MIKTIPLFSGSSGNSFYIKSGNTEVLIDGGVSCTRLCAALSMIGSSVSGISGVFVTHEHTDHINGLEMLCKKRPLPVYINENSANSIRSSGRYPYLSACLSVFSAGSDMTVGDFSVHAFKTPHDSCGSVGYRFCDSDDSTAYATDIGYVTREIANNLFGSKTVIFESNHDLDMLKNGSYPASLKARILSDHGHLSNTDCAKFVPFLAENGTNRIILAHLSAENNTPSKAYDASRRTLDETGHRDTTLEVAPVSLL